MRARKTQKQKPKPTALEKAVELLARQEQSSARLREKLRQRDYEAEEIDAAIARLEERHYLNDEESCARQYQKLYEESGMSVRQIEQKLLTRGFPPSLVRASAPKEEGREERELNAALRSLRSRFRAAALRAKMKQFLYRRGFSYGICDSATSAFLEENPELLLKENESYDE
ncbi:MAG: regulatory protein RecX [Schwartzia sp.]|nr:regulatory protein RecX [Schwartzia sp. (in: firmicutes)]